MAEVLGMIDVLEPIPDLSLYPSSAVVVRIDADTALRFRSLAAYDEWQESIDRQRAALTACAGDPLPGLTETVG